MEIKYKNDANHNYMVIKKEKGPININHEKMAVRNNIEGLLRINLHFIDNEAFYYYEIRSKQSLSRLFEGRYISAAELTGFFKGMVKVFKELEQYLLPTDGILFDPECIYVDIDTCSPEFAFYPSGRAGSRGDSIEELAKFLIDHVDGNDSLAQQLAYDYYEAVTDGVISPEGLVSPFHEAKAEPAVYDKEAIEEEGAGEGGFDYWETQEDMSELDYFLKSDSSEEKDRGILKIAGICLGLIAVAAVCYLILALNPSILPDLKMSEKEYITAGCIIALLFGAAVTAVIFMYNKIRSGKNDEIIRQKKERLEKNAQDPNVDREMREYIQSEEMGAGDEKTTLLTINTGRGAGAVLSGIDNGKNVCFSINRSPFILGKKGDKADGILCDPGVSRIHASIREMNGRYFLSDMNSTNGTFVNGRRLELNETVALEDGDSLGFAGTVLTFRNQRNCPAY